jgi:hypothetical protein
LLCVTVGVAVFLLSRPAQPCFATAPFFAEQEVRREEATKMQEEGLLPLLRNPVRGAKKKHSGYFFDKFKACSASLHLK